MSLDQSQLEHIGRQIGLSLRGGECIELIGDVGAGKTTLTKAIAEGLQVDDDVQSPSFTISREYEARDGLRLAHYDFYRLSDPGIMSYELSESLEDSSTVTVIEWAQTVQEVLPTERIQIRLDYSEDGMTRKLQMDIPKALNYVEVGR